MANFRGWSRRGWSIAAGLALVTAAVSPLPALAAESPADARREAIEIYQAFQKIQKALEKESQPAAGGPVNLPDRPARTVEEPTLSTASASTATLATSCTSPA